MATNDFDVWLDGAPFIDIGGSYEFDVWLDDAPVLEQSEGTSVARRRAEIF